MSDYMGGIFDVGYPLMPQKPSFQINPYITPTESGYVADAIKSQSANYMAANPMAGQGVGSSFARPDLFSLDGFLGGKNADGSSFNGWGGMAMGAIQGLGNAYMGMKQYGLAKEQLQFSKDAFERNFAAQRQMTNTNLQDRQRARVASNPGAYQSVGEYMSKNGVQ